MKIFIKVLIIIGLFCCFSCSKNVKFIYDDNNIEKNIIEIFNENLLDNINEKFDFYIDNDDYKIISNINIRTRKPDEQDSEFTFILVENDILKLYFFKNFLWSINIYEATDLHFLSQYIGYNIRDIIDIFGEPDSYYENKKISYYKNIKNINLDFISNKNDGVITSISINGLNLDNIKATFNHVLKDIIVE